MSVHQKPNGTWFVQYRVPGEKNPRREYFGVGPAGEKKARIRNAEVALLKAKGKQPVAAGKVYLDTIAQAFLTDRKMRGRSEKWLREFAHLLNKYILPALCVLPVEQTTYTDVMAFVEKTWGNRNHATRQRYLAYITALYRFGVEHEMCTTNPLAKWRKTKERKHKMQLTLEDLQKLIEHAAPHLAWAIEVEWELGTRPGASELLSLRWEDVDLRACTIHVRGTKTMDSDRVIPITSEFRDRLAAMKILAESEYVIEYRGKPIVHLRKALRRAAERAGIPYRVRMYDIRHLCASTMLAGGADLAAVSRLLGHASITTTQQHYYHLLKGEMSKAIHSRPSLASQNPGHTQGNTTPEKDDEIRPSKGDAA